MEYTLFWPAPRYFLSFKNIIFLTFPTSKRKSFFHKKFFNYGRGDNNVQVRSIRTCWPLNSMKHKLSSELSLCFKEFNGQQVTTQFQMTLPKRTVGPYAGISQELPKSRQTAFKEFLTDYFPQKMLIFLSTYNYKYLRKKCVLA